MFQFHCASILCLFTHLLHGELAYERLLAEAPQAWGEVNASRGAVQGRREPVAVRVAQRPQARVRQEQAVVVEERGDPGERKERVGVPLGHLLEKRRAVGVGWVRCVVN